MRPFHWRTWFWLSIGGSTVAIASLSAWLVIKNRYDIEVWWYRRQLAQVMTNEEAEPLLQQFVVSHGSPQRWAAFWRTFGETNVRADYWILSAALVDDEEYAMRSFVSVSQKRPEICKGFVHLLRWDSSWTNVGSEALLDEVRSMVHEGFESSNEELGSDNVEIAVLFRLLCWGTGQDDLCRDLQTENMRQAFAQWNSWYEENGPYLRFDETIGRYRIDEEARSNGIRVPPEARRIPAADTPLPGWTGPLPPKE
jgi:hypothetical protein